MWIKICANTNAEDALQAAELGADAVGFVFAPSIRRVTPSQVALISRGLPSTVERVGVFTTGSVAAIASAVEEAGLTCVQMHGGVDLSFARLLGERLGPTISIIQTTHWILGADETSEQEISMRVREVAQEPAAYRLLVDAKVGDASGGLGVRFNWSKARRVLTSVPTLRVIVAGGLTAENVTDAVRELQPWGVDVASGVESAPGKKDWKKLRNFISAARGTS